MGGGGSGAPADGAVLLAGAVVLAGAVTSVCALAATASLRDHGGGGGVWTGKHLALLRSLPPARNRPAARLPAHSYHTPARARRRETLIYSFFLVSC